MGAAVGAVTGVLTGNGLEGAIKGAVIGGTGGAILGKNEIRNDDEKNLLYWRACLFSHQ